MIDCKPCLNLIVVLSVWPNFKALGFSANAAMMATLPRKKRQTISVSIKLQLPLWCGCTFCDGVSFRLVSNGMNLFIRASVEHRGLTWFYHPEKGRYSNIAIYIIIYIIGGRLYVFQARTSLRNVTKPMINHWCWMILIWFLTSPNSQNWTTERWFIMGFHTIWLVVSTPLKNDGVRQLGLFFPIYGKNMFQTTNQL